MPGLVVFRTRVSQANDQLYGSHDGAPLYKRRSSNELLGGAFFATFFLHHAGSVDVGNGQVVAVGQLYQLDAFPEP